MSLPAPQTVLRYEVEVHDQGRVELHLPYAAGVRVTIIVIPEAQEEFPDLLSYESTWQPLVESLSLFSDDFMQQREQPPLQERERAFE